MSYADGVIVFEGASAKRRRVTLAQSGAATWQITSKGGYDSFSVPLAVDYPTLSALGVVAGDRVEIWDGGLIQYRGYISERGLQNTDPPIRGLSGYGRSLDIGRCVCEYPLAFTAAVDLADVFGEVFRSFVLSDFADVVLETEETGVQVSTVDVAGKTVQQVFGELIDLTGGTAIWGCDVAPDGSDRLYLRLVASTTTPTFSQPVPGHNAGAWEGRQQTADIVNRLILTGGDPKFPNLLTNGSFEQIVQAGEEATNLIQNGSFEQVESRVIGTGPPPDFADITRTCPVDWDVAVNLSGDANTSTLINDGAGSEPAPPLGRVQVETDYDNEYVEQERTGLAAVLIEGREFALTWQAQPEDGAIGSGVTGQVRLWWKDSGGSETLALTRTFTFSEGGALSFDERLTIPADCDGFRVRAEKTSAGPDGDGTGVLWDNFRLFDTKAIYTKAWSIKDADLPLVDSIEWARRDGTAKHGGYYVRLSVTAEDTEEGDCEMNPLDYSAITGGQTLRFSGWFRNKPGGRYDKFNMQLRWFDRNRSSVGSTDEHSVEPVAELTDWTYYEMSATAPTGARYVDPGLEFRGGCDYDIDALMLCDVGNSYKLGNTDHYYADGPFVLILRAADVVTVGEDYAVHHSADAPPAGYGRRDKPETVDTLTTIEEMIAFAKLYFLKNAIPTEQPTGPIYESRRALWPGQTVRLVGEAGPGLSGGRVLPIARIQGSQDAQAGLQHILQLGEEQQTLQAMVVSVAKKQKIR